MINKLFKLISFTTFQFSKFNTEGAPYGRQVESDKEIMKISTDANWRIHNNL